MVKKENMRFYITIPRSLAKELKIYAVLKDSTTSAVVVDLIKRELQRKDKVK